MKWSIALLAALLVMIPSGAEELKKPAEDEGHYLVFLADSTPVLIRAEVKIDGKPLLEAWNKFINDLFDRADVNKDGFLDRKETDKVPSPQELFGGGGGLFVIAGGGGVPGLPNIADADGDGKVSRQEFADYFRKHGGAPLRLSQGGGNESFTGRLVLDLGGVAYGNDGGSDAMNRILLALLDTDKDGKLSRKELEAAPAILLKKDADDDEMVTAAELRGQVPSGNGYEFVIGGGGSAPLGPDSPMMLVQRKDVNRRLADALLKRYAHTAEAKKAATLTAKDLGVEADAFRKLDTNGDGKLDRDELSRFADREPDLTLVLNVGAKGGIDTTVKGQGKAAKVTKHKDGSLILNVGNTQLDVRLESNAGGMAFIVDNEAVIKQQFEAADKDNNGYLDMKEARQSGFFAQSFKAMDADGDGKLYLKEVMAYLKRQKDLREKAAASCVTLSFADQGKGLFDLIDTDGDGRLSVREMRNAVKLLEKYDADGDGAISLSEIPRRYQLSARKSSPQNGYFAAPAVVSFSGFGGPAPQRRAEGPLWFRKMDRNHDGDVSRREFLGTEEQFREIDTDGDGLISLKEAEAYDAKMRKKK
jgi:Ca2+-binding EF-hand superfamily protein